MDTQAISCERDTALEKAWSEAIQNVWLHVSEITGLNESGKKARFAFLVIEALTSYLTENKIRLDVKLARNWNAWRDHFSSQITKAASLQEGLGNMIHEFNHKAGGPKLSFVDLNVNRKAIHVQSTEVAQKNASLEITSFLQNETRLLFLFALRGRQLNIADLAQMIGIEMGQCRHILNNFVVRGFIEEHVTTEESVFGINPSILPLLEEFGSRMAKIWIELGPQDARERVAKREKADRNRNEFGKDHITFLSSLRDEKRRKIFECFVNGTHSISEIGTSLSLKHSALVYHIEQLRTAGLLSNAKGRNKGYNMPEDIADHFHTIAQWLSSLKDKDGQGAPDPDPLDDLSPEAVALWHSLSFEVSQLVDALNGKEMMGGALDTMLQIRTSHYVKKMMSKIIDRFPRKLSIIPDVLPHFKEIASWFTKMADKIDADSSIAKSKDS